MTIILSPLLWILYLLASIPLFLIGIPVCAALVLLGRYAEQDSKVFEGRRIVTWTDRWAWLWGNDEEGFGSRRKWGIFLWSGVRNSVHNLFYVRPFGVKPDPARIKFVGDADSFPTSSPPKGESRWSFTWQGPYAGFLWMRTGWAVYQVFIGWKLFPRDIHGIPDSDPRKVMTSFGTDIKFFR